MELVKSEAQSLAFCFSYFEGMKLALVAGVFVSGCSMTLLVKKSTQGCAKRQFILFKTVASRTGELCTTASSCLEPGKDRSLGRQTFLVSIESQYRHLDRTTRLSDQLSCHSLFACKNKNIQYDRKIC